MKIHLFVLVFFLGISLQKTIAGTCFTDAECSAGECCFRHDGPMIVSKRQLTDTLLTSSHGVCEQFKKEGDHCRGFDELNGHCSCGPGLKCVFAPNYPSIPPPPDRRSMKMRTAGIYQVYSRCVPIA